MVGSIFAGAVNYLPFGWGLLMDDILHFLPIYFALAAAILNLVRRQWTLNLISLAVLFISMIPPLLRILPTPLALILPFTGLMVTLILYLTLLNVGGIERIHLFRRPSSGEIFRALVGIFLITILRVFLPIIQQAIFPQVSLSHLLLSLGLVLVGLLQLGTIQEPFYLTIGILTFLSGFQILISALEFSYLLEALFVAVNLLLAIVGAFFIVKNEESKQHE